MFMLKTAWLSGGCVTVKPAACGLCTFDCDSEGPGRLRGHTQPAELLREASKSRPP